MISLTLPLDNRLHAHAKGNWRAKAAATKTARQTAAMVARASGCKPITGPCVVDYLFEVPDRRRRDLANLVQACKPYIDGVVDVGAIPGDHWEVLRIGNVWVKVGDKLAVTLTFRGGVEATNAVFAS
jgi:hypothetical protein